MASAGIGIGTVSQAEDVKVHENFIHHAAAGANQRWPEYGEMAGVNAIRITWGGKNLTYENNVMVVTGTGQSSIRGLWVCPEPTITGVTFRNNTIAAYARSKDVTSRGAICVCGDGKEDDAPILYEGNTVISNLCNVVLGDSYGLGSNSRFVRNTFVREGRREDYRTIQCGYWTPPTLGHQFIDSTFEAGAAFDKPVFAGEGKRDFSVGWTVTIKTSPLAKVSVTDAAGKEAFSGPAGKTGLVDIQLLQYTQTPDKKIDLTPHKIAVELDGKTATKSVTADKKQQVEIDLK